MICNTSGPNDAKIMLVGEAPGKDEELTGRPFAGYAGRTLDWLLSQSGINRAECLITNVFRERPTGNKISYFFEYSKCTIPKLDKMKWIEKLYDDIKQYKPNIVICLGATPLWALTREKGIAKLRGYIMESPIIKGQKVIATYHPQAINYEWKLFYPTILDLKKAKGHSEYPYIPEDPSALHYDNIKPEQFIEYCKEILSKGHWVKICSDIETTIPTGHIKTLGFSHSEDFAMSIRILSGHNPLWTHTEEKEIWYWVGRVLQEKDMIFQNGSFDALVFAKNHGLLTKRIAFDTLLASLVCFPEMPRDLGFLGSICLDVRPWKHLFNENNALYNAEDCANTFGVSKVLEQEMKKKGLYETFKFEMAQIKPSMMLQAQGLAVNEEKKASMIQESERIIAETGSALDTIIGRKINYGSPKQVQNLLYIDLKLPVQYKRRKHATDPKIITSDAESLKKLAKLVPNNPIFNLILEHKKYLKLKSSFLEMEVSPEGKIHTSYNITGSATDDEGRKSFGRWSSSKSIVYPYGSGNLQNIPKEARKIYTVPEGYKFLEADYVQAEAVVVAYLINDRRAKEIFKNRFNASMTEKSKFDIHRYTASMMFGVPQDEVTKEQRRIGKTLRHAGNYDSGPAAISATIGCKQSEAKVLKEMFHKSCPQLRMWYQQIQNQLRETRTLTNIFGRKHRFLDRWGDSMFRSAYSFIPQSSVGDLLNQSLIRLYEQYGQEIHIVLQLHDAIYVIVKEDKVEWCKEKMRECMVRTVEVNHDEMTIDVDFKVGDYWGDMYEEEA